MNGAEIIEAILTDLGIKQAQFITECGLPRSSFSEIKSGKIKSISRLTAAKIVKAYPQFNVKWIMTGEGDMYVQGNSAPVFNNSGNNVSNQQGTIDSGLIGLLKEKDRQLGKRDEQIDRLLTIIERMQS